jgi:pyrroline-5-carboxylate reductase
MAEALVDGMLTSGTSGEDQVYASDPDEERQERFRELVGDNVFADNTRLVREVDVVVLSVKPQILPDVTAEIRDEVTPDHLVMSIVPGIMLERLKRNVGTDRLIRVMPNTPALVGEGASAFCVGEGATGDDIDLADQVLSSVGVCAKVKEEDMDAITGLSGSGPAYVFLAIESLSDGGVKMGLSRTAATRLAAQTVLGAARMVLETGQHPAELKDQVTTPGGTTIEGVHALEQAGLRRAFMDAVEAATEKCRRLGNE